MIKKCLLMIVTLFMMVACSSIEKPDYKSATQEPSIEKEVPMRGADQRQVIEAIVLRVIDGDTIVVSMASIERDGLSASLYESLKPLEKEEVKVRALAIDTPEFTKEKQLYGKESTEFARELLAGKEILLEIDPNATFDNYSRLLAHIFTKEGVNIQKTLLSTGLARVAYLFNEYKYIEEYQAAEKKAIDQKLNIHSIEGYVTEQGFDMNVPEARGISFEDITINGIFRMLDKISNKDLQELLNLTFTVKIEGLI